MGMGIYFACQTIRIEIPIWILVIYILYVLCMYLRECVRAFVNCLCSCFTCICITVVVVLFITGKDTKYTRWLYVIRKLIRQYLCVKLMYNILSTNKHTNEHICAHNCTYTRYIIKKLLNVRREIEDERREMRNSQKHFFIVFFYYFSIIVTMVQTQRKNLNTNKKKCFLHESNLQPSGQ